VSRLLAVLALAAWAGPAWACPSCFDPKQADTNVWLGSTIALSLLPLAMMGGVVGFIAWRVRAAHRNAPSEPLPFRPPADPALR